jgi:hypothetical protein
VTTPENAQKWKSEHPSLSAIPAPKQATPETRKDGDKK